MPRRLLAGVGALTLALLATFVPDIDGVHAATAHCTGWSSTTRPPSTIRVYRSGLHRTVAVDFRQYVRVVVANEWGPTHPRASLRAGAIARFLVSLAEAVREAHGRPQKPRNIDLDWLPPKDWRPEDEDPEL